MPQLDVSTFVPQLVWLAITFVVLYLLMAKFGLPRVNGAIEARRHRLDDDLARAAQLKAEAEAVLAAYQKTLAEARAEAQATIRETTDRFAAEAAERQRQLAEALAGRQRGRAADRRGKRARSCRDAGIAADVARSVTEKLTGSAADEAKLPPRSTARSPSGPADGASFCEPEFWVLLAVVVFLIGVWKPAASRCRGARSAPRASGRSSTRRGDFATRPRRRSPDTSATARGRGRGRGNHRPRQGGGRADRRAGAAQPRSDLSGASNWRRSGSRRKRRRRSPRSAPSPSTSQLRRRAKSSSPSSTRGAAPR